MANKKIKITSSSPALFIPSEGDVIDRIRSLENHLVHLIKVYRNEAPFIKKCYFHDDLVEFWDEIISNPNKLSKLSKTYNFTPLQPQCVIHSFHLLAGLYYSARGYELDKTPRSNDLVDENAHQKKLKCLLKAEKYCSFHAIILLNKYDLENLYDEIRNGNIAKDKIAQILARVEKLKLHGTPGYIHLYRNHLAIADYYEKICNDRDKEAIKNAYKLAVQHLQTALLIEPHCPAAIHNAYFEHGIKRGLTFEHVAYEDLSSAMEGCLKLASRYVTPDVLDRAKEAGAKEAEDFVTRWYAEDFELTHKTPTPCP
ncbi:MAG: DUF5630 domain-containing protein [Gammaproteobacteria bacterium]